MEWAKVLRRMEAGEDQTAEFKQDLGKDLSALGKAVCVFANGAGGLAILGVDDAGSIIGLKSDTHAVHERLTGFLQSGCSQPVIARCGRHDAANGRWIYWIEVPRIRGPEPLQYGGRFFIRRERSSVEPSSRELQELFDVFGFVVTEKQAILAAAIKDIDIDSFRSFQRNRGLETEDEPQLPVSVVLRNARVLNDVD